MIQKFKNLFKGSTGWVKPGVPTPPAPESKGSHIPPPKPPALNKVVRAKNYEVDSLYTVSAEIGGLVGLTIPERAPSGKPLDTARFSHWVSRDQFESCYEIVQGEEGS